MHEDNKEIWKSITGIDSYLFSSYGRIKSFKGNKEKILSAKPSSDGYIACSLRVGNKYLTKRAHQLIAQAFIPNPNNYPQVNHKDTDKANNHIDNLEWCTCKHNINHAFDNNLVTRKKGEESHMFGGNNLNAKLVLNNQNGIYYETVKEAATSLNMKRTTLNAMLTGFRKNKTSFVYA